MSYTCETYIGPYIEVCADKGSVEDKLEKLYDCDMFVPNLPGDENKTIMLPNMKYYDGVDTYNIHSECGVTEISIESIIKQCSAFNDFYKYMLLSFGFPLQVKYGIVHYVD